MNLRHDLPHYAIFHSRNSTGICPLCLMAESTTWQELSKNMAKAQEIVDHELAAAAQNAMATMERSGAS